MKGIKKILVSLVTVAMLLCVGTVNVFAEEKTVTVHFIADGVTIPDVTFPDDGDGSFTNDQIPGVVDGKYTYDGKVYKAEINNNYTPDTNETWVYLTLDTSKTVTVHYVADDGVTILDATFPDDGDGVFTIDQVPGVVDGKFTYEGKVYDVEINGVYSSDNETWVNLSSKTVTVHYVADDGVTIPDATFVDKDADGAFTIDQVPGVVDGKFKFDGKLYKVEINGVYSDTDETWVNLELDTKKVKIEYITVNGIKLDSEEIYVASDAEKFESTLLTKVTDGVFEKDGDKYTIEYNGYIIDNEDDTYTGIVNIIKINNEVDTTLFVNLKYGDQYVGQVILHKTSEKNDPVTFKYEDYRDQLTVVANNVKYYVPEEVVGDFAWTLAEGGEAEANVYVTADEKELTLKVNLVYNGNTIYTVKLCKTVLLGESYKFTTEDLAGELPGLTYKVGEYDTYQVIESNLNNGELATITADDTCSVDVRKLASSTGGSSSTTTNTTTKPVVNTSAK